MAAYLDPEVAGGGAYVCVPCSRPFVDAKAMDEHTRTKAHKKRLKEVAQPQWTQAEAEAAGGKGGGPAPKLGGKSLLVAAAAAGAGGVVDATPPAAGAQAGAGAGGDGVFMI
jgi:hypothetical protein